MQTSLKTNFEFFKKEKPKILVKPRLAGLFYSLLMVTLIVDISDYIYNSYNSSAPSRVSSNVSSNAAQVQNYDFAANAVTSAFQTNKSLGLYYNTQGQNSVNNNIQQIIDASNTRDISNISVRVISVNKNNPLDYDSASSQKVSVDYEISEFIESAGAIYAQKRQAVVYFNKDKNYPSGFVVYAVVL